MASITFCIPLFLAITFPAFVSGEPRRLSFNLIHRDSLVSPLRNHGKNLRTLFPSDHVVIQFDIHQNRLSRFVFLMNFSIGQPPALQLTIMDTGSSLLWVHCFPCETCLIQSMLNPFESSSYTSLTCSSAHCRFVPGSGCNSGRECTYQMSYLGSTTVEGVVATENLTFDTQDEGSIVVPNVIFGCTHHVANWSTGGVVTGVFGLGPLEPSIVPTMNYKFSYCIGNLSDPNYDHNKLILGEGAIIQGDSTPFYYVNGFYGVVLEGISVGLERLDIDPTVFRLEIDNEHVVVIDSGTTFTYLAMEAFTVLRDKVRSLLDRFMVQTRVEEEGVLCYEGYIYRDLRGFPAVSFHLSEDLDMVLEGESLFYDRGDGEFCLAVVSNVGHPNMTVIGMSAQQYYNVGYDVADQRLYLERIECELLED